MNLNQGSGIGTGLIGVLSIVCSHRVAINRSVVMTRPKHEIVTDKIRSFGMQFGGEEFLRRMIARNDGNTHERER